MDHGSDVTGGNELVDEGSFERRHVTVLNQLFIADRLLEATDLELNRVPIMDVHVGVLLDRRPVSEVGQQAEVEVFVDGRFQTEPGPANQKRVDVVAVFRPQKFAVVGLNLACDAKDKVLVG